MRDDDDFDDDDEDAPMTRARALRALGLARDVTDAATIKRAYRARCLRWHPDKHPETMRDRAKRKFLAIAGAYRALTTVNFDHARWRASYAIPPLQTLEDVLALALGGRDPVEIDAMLRARGEFRPHEAFGVDVRVPWAAGARSSEGAECDDGGAYATTRGIGSVGDATTALARVGDGGAEGVGRGLGADAVAGASSARPWERVGGVGFDDDDDGRASARKRANANAVVMRPDLDATSADAARAAEAANDAGAEAFRARDFDAAFEYYTEAVRLAPRTVAYLGNQAAAALKVGGGGDTRRERDALTRAVEACVAAVGVDDEYVRGYVRGAKALLVLGDRGDGDVRALRRAREMLERALDVDPAHAGAAATLKDVNVSLQLFDDSDDDA